MIDGMIEDVPYNETQRLVEQAVGKVPAVLIVAPKPDAPATCGPSAHMFYVNMEDALVMLLNVAEFLRSELQRQGKRWQPYRNPASPLAGQELEAQTVVELLEQKEKDNASAE